MKTSRRLAAIAGKEAKRFAATVAMRAAQVEHSRKRTDHGNSTVARAAPSSFRPLTEAETEAILGGELLAALSGAPAVLHPQDNETTSSLEEVSKRRHALARG